MNNKPAIFIIIILLACGSTLFSHCKKEYSYEGGNIDSTITGGPVTTPMAEFSLTGSPGDCSSPRISGDYFAGQKFTNANFVEVNVDVLSIGTFSINTDTINGIYYAAQGVFTKKGIQTVLLKGTGTPVSPGDIVMSTDAGTSKCSFYLAVLTPGYPATYVLESNYDSSCTGHIVKGVYNKNQPLDTSVNKVVIKTFITVPGVYTISTQTVNGISFSLTSEFTNAGVNYVSIQGKGTPLKAGIFTYRLHIIGPAPLGGANCNFDIQVN